MDAIILTLTYLVLFLICFIRYLLFEVASQRNNCGINFTTEDLDSDVIKNMKLKRLWEEK